MDMLLKDPIIAFAMIFALFVAFVAGASAMVAAFRLSGATTRRRNLIWVFGLSLLAAADAAPQGLCLTGGDVGEACFSFLMFQGLVAAASGLAAIIALAALIAFGRSGVFNLPPAITLGFLSSVFGVSAGGFLVIISHM